MAENANQAAAERGYRVEVLPAPPELDLASADGLVQQGHAALARHPRLLLLDLTGSVFCDARGLSALVRIANQADAAGCPYALIAPLSQVTKMLRISRLDQRLPVFTTSDDALDSHTPMNSAADGEQGWRSTHRGEDLVRAG
jgi:anti-sigma B factor antagonist